MPNKHLDIKPAPGLVVRFPDKPQRLLATDGERVPRTPYWLRRLRDKDVVACELTTTTVAENDTDTSGSRGRRNR